MAKKAVLRTAQEIFALDKAFFLIEGHPSIVTDAALLARLIELSTFG
jgi:hypothetical protein